MFRLRKIDPCKKWLYATVSFSFAIALVGLTYIFLGFYEHRQLAKLIKKLENHPAAQHFSSGMASFPIRWLSSTSLQVEVPKDNRGVVDIWAVTFYNDCPKNTVSFKSLNGRPIEWQWDEREFSFNEKGDFKVVSYFPLTISNVFDEQRFTKGGYKVEIGQMSNCTTVESVVLLRINSIKAWPDLLLSDGFKIISDDEILPLRLSGYVINKNRELAR